MSLSMNAFEFSIRKQHHAAISRCCWYWRCSNWISSVAATTAPAGISLASEAVSADGGDVARVANAWARAIPFGNNAPPVLAIRWAS